MSKLNSNKWISIVGYIASLLTIGQTLVSLILLSANQQPMNSNSPLWQQIISLGAVLLCIVSLCIILVNSQIKNERIGQELKIIENDKISLSNDLKERNDIISSLSQINHNINHQNRQMLYELYEELYADTHQSSKIEVLNNKYRGYLQNFTSNVKSAFDTITKDKSCAVYISLLKEYNDDFFVETAYRDPTSYTVRNNLDMQMPSYNINNFTPFKHILSETNNDTYFACDNCKDYRNFCDRNDDWLDFYNSCLTVPIRARTDKSTNTHNYIGFITVDNRYGRLNNKDAINLLCSYADTLYMNMNIMIDLINMAE